MYYLSRIVASYNIFIEAIPFSGKELDRRAFLPDILGTGLRHLFDKSKGKP